MSSPIGGPLDITQFNSDLQNTSSPSGGSELDVWYGEYQTFYPGATVQEFEEAMLPFANAVQEAYGDFDPSNPTVYTQFLGAVAATTASVNPRAANPVNYGFRDSDTNSPTPTSSELLATWVAFYKEYNPADTTSLSDIQQGIDLEFNYSLGSFLQDTQAYGGLFFPSDLTFEQYQGVAVLATFTALDADLWQAAYEAFYPAASDAEFAGVLGQYASQQSSPINASEIGEFQDYIQNNALSPPFATWQAAYATYFPGSSSAAFQTFLNTFINGLPTQLTVANASQFFAQFQGYVVANSAAFQASGGAGAQAWQDVYEQYYPADTSTDPLTDPEFLTFLGQFSSQQTAALDPTSSLPQYRGALAESLLNSTQESLLQALYTQANPGASTATYLSYIGSLNPQPPTADMLAGLVLYNILSDDALFSEWYDVYYKYYPPKPSPLPTPPALPTQQLLSFLGNFVLTQPTAINPQNALFQFAGATALSCFSDSAYAQWQAYYLQFYPSGSLSVFQSLVGEVDSQVANEIPPPPDNKVDPVISFGYFQDVVLDSSLVPPLATWQAVYADLGLPPSGSPRNFQSDLNGFVETQTIPLNLNTVYQSFISYLLTTYPTAPKVQILTSTWQTAYDQNFQQGSIPTPFASDLARYLSFQYQVNAGGITDADVAAGQQALSIGGFSSADITAWQAAFSNYNPGAAPEQFYYLVGLFASYQPSGQITPSLLPQFSNLVESGRYYGFIVNPAAIELGKIATAGFSPTDLATWQAFFNSYNPGANINQFYSFMGQQFAPNIPVGPLKTPTGQIVANSTSYAQFQAWVANNAFVTWTNSMSQVDYHSYQVVYQELFPSYTAAQFQDFLTDFAGQFPVPTSPANSTAFYDLFVGTALYDNGIFGGSPTTYAPFKTFYDQYYPGATAGQFETFLGRFANQLLLSYQPEIQMGLVDPSSLLSNSLTNQQLASYQTTVKNANPSQSTFLQANFPSPDNSFEQQIVDAAFTAALNSYTGVGNFTFPPSGTATLVPSAYASWYSAYQQVFPSKSISDFQAVWNGFITAEVSQGVTLNPTQTLPLFIGSLFSLNETVTFNLADGSAIKAAVTNFIKNENPPVFALNNIANNFLSSSSFYQYDSGIPLEDSMTVTSNSVYVDTNANPSTWANIAAAVGATSIPPPFYLYLSPTGEITSSIAMQTLVSGVYGNYPPGTPIPDPILANAISPLLDSNIDFNTLQTGFVSWQDAYNQNNAGATTEQFLAALGRFLLNHNMASNGSATLGTSATAGFSVNDRNTWWNYYKQYNLGDTSTSPQSDSRFLALVGQLASELNVTTLNASTHLAAFQNLVNSISYIDWTNSMSKVDFTSWESFYSKYFPSATAADFQAFLNTFTSQFPTPLSPANPLQLFNQFQGAVVAATLSAVQLSAWQSFYQTYYPGATTADFQTALGKFANLQSGVVSPAASPPLAFQRQVVDDAFTAALTNYETAVRAAQAQGNPLPPDFSFPPSGTASLVPSAYASWYDAYQQIIPGATLPQFQNSLNDFIKVRILQGMTINPTQTLSIFVGQIFSFNSVNLKGGATLAIKTALYNYLRTIGIPNPAGGGGVLSFTYLNPLDSNNVSQIANSIQISSDGLSLTISIPNIQDLPWQYSPFSPYAMTFTYNSNGLSSSVNLVNPNPTSPGYNTVLFPAGSPITDPTLVSAFSNQVGFPAWKTAYDQNNPNPTQEGFLGALGRFLLNNNIASNGSASLGASATSGFTNEQLNSWWDYYKVYNLADKSTSAQTDTRFLALVGQLSAQLNVTTLNASTHLAAFQNLVDSVSFVAWTNSMSKVDFTSWESAYKKFFPSNTSEQFQDFLVNFLSTLPAPINPNDPLVNPSKPLELYNQFVGAMLLNSGVVGGTPSATYSDFQTFYHYYSDLGYVPSNFEAYLGEFANQLLLSNQTAIQNGSITPASLLGGSIAQFRQKVVDDSFAVALAEGQGGVFITVTAAPVLPSKFASWKTFYDKMFPGSTLNQYTNAFFSFIGYQQSIGTTIDPTQTLPLFVGTQLYFSNPTSFFSWQQAYNQNNAGATPTEFLEALGRYTIQQGTVIQQATGQPLSINPTDANSPVNPNNMSGFVAWVSDSSKIDFTSWQAIYTQIFPTLTAAQFQSFLNGFMSALPAPANPSDPLVSPKNSYDLYNQFVGAMLVAGYPTGYTDLVNTYMVYNPGSTFVDGLIHLGQFANQLLLNNLAGISNGTVAPANLFNPFLPQFQQQVAGAFNEQVVKNSFTNTLNTYVKQVNALLAQNPSATVPNFIFPPNPPSGFIAPVPTLIPGFENWFTAYQQINPQSDPILAIFNFQSALNSFITTKVAQGVVIDPAQSISLFVGGLLATKIEETTAQPGVSDWQTLFNQNQLGISTTPTTEQKNAFLAALGAFFLNAPPAPSGTGKVGVTLALKTAGLQALAPLDPSIANGYWNFYKAFNSADQSTSYSADDEFLAFVGQFYLQQGSVSLTSSGSIYAAFQSQVMAMDYHNTGFWQATLPTPGFTADQLNTWWGIYKQYNINDNSPSPLQDAQFLASLGMFASEQQLNASFSQQVNATTLNPADPSGYQAFVQSFPAVNFTAWSNYVLGVNTETVVPTVSLVGNANRRKQALILSNLFKILNKMIGTIQQAVTTVGSRLTFYGKYQQDITSELSDMPVYTVAGPGPIATPVGADTNTQSIYSQYQSSANSIVQQRQATLRSLRDSVGSLTQQLQTTITQLNDAATNQGSIGTSILQTLSSIQTLIFR